MSRHRIEWERAAHLRAQFPTDGRPQIAFAGRSNVGKSSLLNQLFERKLAKVSQTPGKTRSINFYDVDGRYYLVDLPGYGYAKRSKTERAKFSALIGQFLEGNPHLCGVVHLVDIRHAPSELDRRISSYLHDLLPQVLTVLTKADKLSRGAGAKQRQIIGRDLDKKAEGVLPFSTQDGRGTRELWSWILAQTERAKAHV
jgi:GTP-binding protein